MAHYQVDYEARSVILPITHQEHEVSESGIKMILDSEGLVWKDEHHITAIPSDFGRRLSRRQFQAVGERLAEVDCTDVTVEDVAFIIFKRKMTFMPGFKDKIYHPRKSLVAPALSRQMLDDLLEAFDVAEVPDADTHTLLPFQHVTLATGNRSTFEQRGIGLNTLAELEKCRIGDPILGWKPGSELEGEAASSLL